MSLSFQMAYLLILNGHFNLMSLSFQMAYLLMLNGHFNLLFLSFQMAYLLILNGHFNLMFLSFQMAYPLKVNALIEKLPKNSFLYIGCNWTKRSGWRNIFPTWLMHKYICRIGIFRQYRSFPMEYHSQYWNFSTISEFSDNIGVFRLSTIPSNGFFRQYRNFPTEKHP